VLLGNGHNLDTRVLEAFHACPYVAQISWQINVSLVFWPNLPCAYLEAGGFGIFLRYSGLGYPILEVKTIFSP
jgi:hypothetical protein